MAEAAVNTAPMSNKAEEKSNKLDKKQKFDKVAYQRDYMRKRRAAAKQCT